MPLRVRLHDHMRLYASRGCTEAMSRLRPCHTGVLRRPILPGHRQDDARSQTSGSKGGFNKATRDDAGHQVRAGRHPVRVVGSCVEINQCVGCSFSSMTRPCRLRRAVTNRHRHAIEQASRRWRGGRRDGSARTRRKILISTQVKPSAHGVPERRAGGLRPGTGVRYSGNRSARPARQRRLWAWGQLGLRDAGRLGAARRAEYRVDAGAACL